MFDSRHLFGILLLFTSSSLLSACATGASRPDSISGSEATGSGFECTAETVSGDQDHFIVDWSDGDRAALESAMNRGVAVVSYSCDGPKILKACSVEGAYEYAAVSPKTQLVEMKDKGELSAHFGGVPQFPADIVAEMAQGRSLNLAYTLVGTQTTDVFTVGQDQLEGRCDGATHFVFEAQLGAFVVDTAEAGMARTAAEMMEYGSASASTESERAATATDGDQASCAMASSGDYAPVEGCKAMVRASLMAIQ